MTTKPMPVRQEVLREAVEATVNDRNERYGEPDKIFWEIAEQWQYLTGHMFTSPEVAMCMAAVKLVRAKNNMNDRDSFVDLAGYAAIACELQEGQTKAPISAADLPVTSAVEGEY